MHHSFEYAMRMFPVIETIKIDILLIFDFILI